MNKQPEPTTRLGVINPPDGDTPSPTTPSPKGDYICEICGEKTFDHTEEQLKNCIAKSINNSITKTTWFR